MSAQPNSLNTNSSKVELPVKNYAEFLQNMTAILEQEGKIAADGKSRILENMAFYKIFGDSCWDQYQPLEYFKGLNFKDVFSLSKINLDLSLFLHEHWHEGLRKKLLMKKTPNGYWDWLRLNEVDSAALKTELNSFYNIDTQQFNELALQLAIDYYRIPSQGYKYTLFDYCIDDSSDRYCSYAQHLKKELPELLNFFKKLKDERKKIRDDIEFVKKDKKLVQKVLQQKLTQLQANGAKDELINNLSKATKELVELQLPPDQIKARTELQQILIKHNITFVLYEYKPEESEKNYRTYLLKGLPRNTLVAPAITTAFSIASASAAASAASATITASVAPTAVNPSSATANLNAPKS